MNKGQPRREVCFTLDVLTDGSEYTGHGTIFLSAWKKPQHIINATGAPTAGNAWLEEAMAMGPPWRRYAISGLADMTARLAADQRLKLASTSAIFLPSFECMDGLSALLMALHAAGSSALHLVGAHSDTMEELASLTLGPRRSLDIANCQVPQDPSVWWQVFQDDYLIVHASRRGSSGSDSVTFLFSMQYPGQLSTMLVIPPQCRNVGPICSEIVEGNLPLLNEGNTRVQIDSILLLNPLDQSWNTIRNFHGQIFVTAPLTKCGLIDRGILIRSQRVIQHLAEQLSIGFPTVATNEQAVPDRTEEDYVLQLYSCSTIVIHIKSNKGLSLLDRQKAIWERPIGGDWEGTLMSLREFMAATHTERLPHDNDENEIDLEDEDEADGQEKCDSIAVNVSENSIILPQLLVLGTGSATPSAVRGASSHALLFSRDGTNTTLPTYDIFLLDCGEGAATMLSRYGPMDWRKQIRGIWISHAHLDHYGGLITVLRAVSQERQQPDLDTATQSAKRRRMDTDNCCWVMAPPKVLRYVDLCLGCSHGRRKSDGRQLFEPRWHNDPTVPPGPWTHFQNIKVAHNCFPSYALLIGWQRKEEPGSTTMLCFSGDTRPCGALVRACSTASSASSRSFLMLHEATFEDEEQEQAERKKHSTVSEAIMIARRAGATRLLLTHFSQRYVSLQALAASPASMKMGLAMDGLYVPLP